MATGVARYLKGIGIDLHYRCVVLEVEFEKETNGLSRRGRRRADAQAGCCGV
jgi:hypothetical protein